MISVIRKGLFGLLFCSTLLLQAEISIPVTTDTYGIVSGRTLVYLDYIYLTGTMFYASVFKYDLETGTKTEVLPTDNSTPYYIYYGFDQGHLPYMALSGTGGGMMKSTGGGAGGPGGGGVQSYIDYLHTETGATQRLVSDTSYKEIIWIGGGKLVWVDYRHKTASDVNGEIYILPIGGNAQRLTETTAYEGEPFTDGSRVVWTEYSQGSIGNIEMLTLSSGERKIIDPRSTHQGSPRVYGDWVVWVDYRNTGSDAKNGDIFAHRISTGETRAICTAPKFQGKPFVHDNFLVWEDFRNAEADSLNADIYGYDLETDEQFSLITASGYQGRPTIFGDTLCYINTGNTDMSLRVTSLSEISTPVHTLSTDAAAPREMGAITVQNGRIRLARKFIALGDNIELYDSRGKLVSRCDADSEINISNTATGFYTAALRRNGNTLSTRTIFVP